MLIKNLFQTRVQLNTYGFMFLCHHNSLCTRQHTQQEERVAKRSRENMADFNEAHVYLPHRTLINSV